MIGRPSESEYGPFYAGYVSLVPETDILAVLEAQGPALLDLDAQTPTDREVFRYASGKWSVREVLGHLVDTERVFGYRGFCISRAEEKALPGFEEGDYVARSTYGAIPVQDLAAEFVVCRSANLIFLRRLGELEWRRTGMANTSAVSVLAIAYTMAGHVRHHLGVLRDRYGVPSAV